MDGQKSAEAIVAVHGGEGPNQTEVEEGKFHGHERERKTKSEASRSTTGRTEACKWRRAAKWNAAGARRKVPKSTWQNAYSEARHATGLCPARTAVCLKPRGAIKGTPRGVRGGGYSPYTIRFSGFPTFRYSGPESRPPLRALTARGKVLAGTGGKTAKISTKKTSPVTTREHKSAVKILPIIRTMLDVTVREMVESTGLSVDDVHWHIRELKSFGHLRRVGSDKGGHWEVMD